MHRALLRASLFMILALVFPATGADENKSEAKKSDARDKGEVKEKAVQIGQFSGQLVRVEENGQKIHFVYKEPYRDGNGIAYRDKNVDFPVGEDMVVRLAQPPIKFDEKGRPRKYSSKELEEMKGPDKRAFGYAGDVDSLRPDQAVFVRVGKKRSAPRHELPVILEIRVLGEPKTD